MRNAIAIIGSINQDIIFKVPRLPQKGETLTADGFVMCGGGKGANQSVQCAKLGAKTYMAGRVGCDSFGEALTNNLRNYGVDVSYISRSDSFNTGIGSNQVLSDGSLYATIVTGANFDMDISYVDSIEPLLHECKIVVLQMEIPMPVIEETIRRAKKHDCYVILNAAPAKPIDMQALQLVDCLIVNESEASFFAGTEIHDVESATANVTKLLSLVSGEVIITLGKGGSLLCERTGNTHFSADMSVQAVDTTGAGDSYVGAIAVKTLGGADRKDSCQFASRVADFAVTRMGAQDGMPSLGEI